MPKVTQLVCEEKRRENLDPGLHDTKVNAI